LALKGAVHQERGCGPGVGSRHWRGWGGSNDPSPGPIGPARYSSVNAALLIDAIVRQTMVLVAQLATSGGLRAPLAHVAGQVFLDLTNELETQGVSRKVSADMFGMALRAYRKKRQRLAESSTERGRSLWELVLEYLAEHELCTRQDVMRRFRNDDEVQVRSVLHDLVESGLVFCSGTNTGTIYRCTTPEEQRAVQRAGPGLEELLWAVIFREGRRSVGELARACGKREEDLLPALKRLQDQGRVEKLDDGRYRAQRFVVPIGAETGWEAAMLDHYHALVKTLCVRLQGITKASNVGDVVGGSTFTFKIWPEHPHHAEVLGTLRALRERLSTLRSKVEDWNEANGSPRESLAVTIYAGQCVLEQSADEPQDGSEPSPAESQTNAED
jgi:hypothetical protein